MPSISSPVASPDDTSAGQEGLSEHESLRIRTAAYQQALYQAWFATALEQTKSVFTLASAGVGVALTLIFGEQRSGDQQWGPIWLLLAAVMFALAACLCIVVFRTNKPLISKVAHQANALKESGLARRADKGAFIAFGVGLVFLVFAAVARIWL
jgi:hypothetical protein